MNKIALATAITLISSTTAFAACPVGYTCDIGIPVFHGTGPNCSHYTIGNHEHGVMFNEIGTLAGVSQLQTLQSAIDNNRPITVLSQATDQLCNLNTGTVLSIKGISP